MSMAYYENKRLDNWSGNSAEVDVSAAKADWMQRLIEAATALEVYEDLDIVGKVTYRLDRDDYVSVMMPNGRMSQGYTGGVLNQDNAYVEQQEKIFSRDESLYPDRRDREYNRGVAKLLESLVLRQARDAEWFADGLMADGTSYDKAGIQPGTQGYELCRTFSVDRYDDIAHGVDCLTVTGERDNGEFRAFGIDATLNTKYTQDFANRKLWHLSQLLNNQEITEVKYFRPSDFTDQPQDDVGVKYGLANLPRFIASAEASTIKSLAQAEFLENNNEDFDYIRESFRLGNLVLMELYAQAYIIDKLAQKAKLDNALAASDPNSPLNRSSDKNRELLDFFRQALIKRRRHNLLDQANGDNEKMAIIKQMPDSEALKQALFLVMYKAENEDVECTLDKNGQLISRDENNRLFAPAVDSQARALLAAFMVQLREQLGELSYQYLLKNEGSPTAPANAITTSEPLNILSLLDKYCQPDIIIPSSIRQKVHLPDPIIRRRASRSMSVTPKAPVAPSGVGKSGSSSWKKVRGAAKKIMSTPEKPTPVSKTVAQMTPEEVNHLTSTVSALEESRRGELLEQVIEAIEQLKQKYIKEVDQYAQYYAGNALESTALKHFQREDLEQLFISLAA